MYTIKTRWQRGNEDVEILRDISLKVNVIEWLVFELRYYDLTDTLATKPQESPLYVCGSREKEKRINSLGYK